MPKQQTLIDDPKVIPELTDLAEKYIKAKNKRIKLLAEELALKDDLAAMMKGHKLETYRDDDLVVIVETKEKVKAKHEAEEAED